MIEIEADLVEPKTVQIDLSSLPDSERNASDKCKHIGRGSRRYRCGDVESGTRHGSHDRG